MRAVREDAAMSPAHRGQRREPGVTVWDGSLRLFHWALVLLIAASLASGFFAPVLWLRWHLIAGAAIAALLGYRLVWGAFGPTHARFRDFARPPRVVLAHVSELLAGTAPRHLGHNPLGALMVFALLGMLAVLVATGTVVLGGMLKQGPLAHFTAFSLGAGLLGVHQVLAFLLGALIAGHLAGVAAESWRARENLVRAMLDGRKAPLAQAPAPVAARPWLAGGIIAAVLLGGGGAGRGPRRPAGTWRAAGEARSGLCRAVRRLPHGVSAELGAGGNMGSDPGRSARSLRRRRQSVAGTGGAHRALSRRQFRRALGHAAGAPAAGGGTDAAPDRDTVLAAHASRHPARGVRVRYGWQPRRLRRLPPGTPPQAASRRSGSMCRPARA